MKDHLNIASNLYHCQHGLNFTRFVNAFANTEHRLHTRNALSVEKK